MVQSFEHFGIVALWSYGLILISLVVITTIGIDSPRLTPRWNHELVEI